MSGFVLSAPLLWVPILFLITLALGYLGAPGFAFGLLALLTLAGLGLSWPWLVGFALLASLFIVKPLRRAVVSGPLLKLFQSAGFLPAISQTEREALEAGTVWADGELFSGRPDFDKLRAEPYPGLTEEEQAFLDGPVETVCRMTDDWEVWQRRDLSPEVWEFLKRERFFGMIIPREYGGLGFRASTNSAVVSKLSSRSGPLGITVMVPNSLGPAELLLHYGTEEQKQHYLPRLADGREIPAFALTEPGAGSDAGAITSSGEVFRGDDGELYLRLNWQKRYITLAAISTLLGMAFKLRDPKNLLGKGEELGITCALVPTDTPGVVLGRRHDPLGVPFYNCPTEGHDVVVPLGQIIGGAAGAGRGWLMLMECLAAGRGISLPASSTAAIKMAARVGGAYAAVRKQFGLSIGKFEGVQEPLARMAGRAYLLEAARRYTLGALDSGAKPAVVTAMMKYNATELARDSVNDAMDVLGGAAISRGPRNTLAHAYIATPISITVEGANILTRTLVIFGQGAIRCHPFAYRELGAVAAGDVVEFDDAFWGHVHHVMRNGFRTVLLSLTRGALGRSPVSGPAAKYYKKLDWSSATFAFLADMAMGMFGGDLKRKEALTGRFADAFGWMYLGQATLRRFEAEGSRPEDRAYFEWSMQHSLARIQEALAGILDNFDAPFVGPLLRGPAALWFRLNRISPEPSDALSRRVAMALQEPGAARDRLTTGMFLTGDVEDAVGRIENAFVLSKEAEPVAAKIKDAMRAKRLPKAKPLTLLEQARDAKIITVEEYELVMRAEAAREDAIQVDSFQLEEYLETAVGHSREGHAGAA